MPYAEVNRLRLFYCLDGEDDAPPVLFISGLGSDSRSWALIVKHLQSDYRCISFDNRDSGRSDRASTFYTISDMASDARGLLQALGIKQADIVGFSMGGAIAQELAISHPEVVRRLVLIATYCSGDPRGTAIFEGFKLLRQRLSAEEYYRVLFPWTYTHQEYAIPGLIEVAIQQAVNNPYPQEQDAYERQVAATTTFFSEERLGSITQPTLLIFGDEDLFTPLRFARDLQRGIRGSRLVTLAGAGHGLRSTRSREVAFLIRAFLEDDRSA